MLTYRILKEAGLNGALGGDVGDSCALKVAEREHDWYVWEIGSFQLDGMREFRADIAVLMNITPDHLDRYGFRMQSYIESKMRIVQNQTYNDFFIYSDDDLNISAELARRELPMRLLPFTAKSDEGITPVSGHEHGPLQGAFAAGDDFIAAVGERRFAMPVGDLKIKGLHNVYDAMAATMAAMAAGVPDESLRSTLESFNGVEHRMEPAGEINGVEYINDSKATNVDSTWYALQAMTKQVVWIAGGTDKGNDYTPLKEFARTKVKTLVCLGVDNSKLTRSLLHI